MDWVASPMLTPRRGHLAVLVEGNGSVLIAGGSAADEPLAQTELFEPWNDAFIAAGPLTAPRKQLTGAALGNGAVLAAGGLNANGPNAACGVNSGPALVFSGAETAPDGRYYLNGQTATIGGSGFKPNALLNFELRRRLSPSSSISIPGRLLTASGITGSLGGLSFTPIMNILTSDGGEDFVILTSGPGGVAYAGFRAKLRTSFTFTRLVDSVLTRQPIPVRATLSADHSANALSTSLGTPAEFFFVATARAVLRSSASQPPH